MDVCAGAHGSFSLLENGYKVESRLVEVGKVFAVVSRVKRHCLYKSVLATPPIKS